MAGASVKLVEVCKQYKDKQVVTDVSMDIDEGDFLTILGPSGAGKTTVLKMIAGFTGQTDGDILLDGKNIARTPTHKRNVGMLFQNYALFPHMNVYANIAFPLSVRKYPKGKKEEAIKTILDRVKMTGYEDRLPRELSGGQQQRVALARALVFNPPLLLLDEPMAALDKQLRKHMQLEIKHLHEELGLTTISVTHDQEEALTMATKVCVMQEGRVAQIASPQEIYERPKNVFVARFIGEANVLTGYIQKKSGNIVTVRLMHDLEIDLDDDNYVYFLDEDVSIIVRPEKFRLVPDSWKGFKIRGEVTHILYVGEALKLTVRTAFPEPLMVKIFTTSSLTVRPGDTVTLGADTKDIVLVKNRYYREDSSGISPR